MLTYVWMVFIFVHLHILKGTAIHVSDQCPRGFKSIGRQCFLISRHRANWGDALSKCDAIGAVLASIKDTKTFKAYMNDHYRGKVFWLGASDMLHEGWWIWVSGGLMSPEFPWAIGRPRGGKYKNCLTISDKNGYDDEFCLTRHYYVCEANSTKVSKPCPRGFKDVGGHCFSMSHHRVNWGDAVAKCEDKGHVLATIKDAKTFKTFMNEHYRGKIFWVGASDMVYEGWWIWVSGGLVSPRFPWPNGQPSIGDKKKNCLTIGYKNDYHDEYCYSKHYYVCQANSTKDLELLEEYDGWFNKDLGHVTFKSNTHWEERIRHNNDWEIDSTDINTRTDGNHKSMSLQENHQNHHHLTNNRWNERFNQNDNELHKLSNLQLMDNWYDHIATAQNDGWTGQIRFNNGQNHDFTYNNYWRESFRHNGDDGIVHYLNSVKPHNFFKLFPKPHWMPPFANPPSMLLPLLRLFRSTTDQEFQQEN